MKKLNLLLTAVATLGLTAATIAQVPNYVPTNGLVGWWPFNGNANDESGNGNHGTVNGATLASDRNGNTNKAYSFDGINDFIGIGSQNISSSGFAISCWFNANLLKQQAIYYQGGQEFNLGFFSPSNSILAGVKCNASTWYFTNNGINTNLNQWHHLIINYFQNGKIYFYFDNALVDSSSNVPCSTFYNPGLPSSIGAYSSGSRWFSGYIDDIGIWNRAITPQEITNLYNAVNCANNTAITPQTNALGTSNTATFTASTSDPSPSYVWQSDYGQGFQTLNNVGNYSGTKTNKLSISNVQLRNHMQPFRVISTSGNCIDTSNVANIMITDTCILTKTDTIHISVTDTLIINTKISGITPPGNTNTIKVFPNPTYDHITINYGNFAIMSGYQLKIENSLGQQVFQTNITQPSNYLSLATWGGKGLYIVKIINPQGNTIEIRKIILQ